MRVKEIKIYNAEDVKNDKVLAEKCHNYWLKHLFYFQEDDLLVTLQAFEEMFNISVSYSINSYDIDIQYKSNEKEEEIRDLTGIRLLKYLINNYHDGFTEPKYYSLWSKKELEYTYYKEGYPVLKKRHSKILRTREYPLTGVCYDQAILEPIYDFLKAPSKDINYSELIQKCLESWLAKVNLEYEYQQSKDYFLEELEYNDDWEFYETGEIV